jgi:hypothetical protein
MASPTCFTSTEGIHPGAYNILFKFIVSHNVVVVILASCLRGSRFQYWLKDKTTVFGLFVHISGLYVKIGSDWLHDCTMPIWSYITVAVNLLLKNYQLNYFFFFFFRITLLLSVECKFKTILNMGQYVIFVTSLCTAFVWVFILWCSSKYIIIITISWS